MGIKVKVPTAAQIEQLRQKFNVKYEQAPPAVPFHAVDIDRIRGDNLWLQRFLEMYDLEIDTAIDKLWDTCIWRQEYGANELSESKLNGEYLKEGSIFVHSHDIDGKPLLIFRVRLHSKTKNLDELIKIVVYWVERVQRERHLEQLSIFFDMAGTGLATLDLDFVKRIIEVFKMYYPNTLNYILVYELAWVLSAAFKVIRALLPPKAVEILKMITKKDVTQYVPKDNCLASWGGSDNYQFRFVPEQKRAPLKVVVANGQASAANAGDEEPSANVDKKVHFATTGPMVLKDANTYAELHTPTDIMLSLEPSDFVNFDSQNAEAVLNIKCIAKVPVTYKIQTTSPEKFRVRPRCGVLSPNESAEVGIWLKSEHALSDEAKDKFLVMGMAAGGKDCSSADVAELWKSKPPNSPDIEQHRLVCRLGDGDKSGKSEGSCKPGSGAPCDLKKPMDLEEQAQLIQRQLKTTQRLQYATLVVIFLLVIGFGFLFYEQMHRNAAASGAGAGTCSANQKAFNCNKRK